ncbi:PREDICTED: uncharacterized protein LOC109583778 [Amphimedon queenslandica]|uniref:Uncharacterized protein n=1 Tax=Amphimedon queenslandica TaxID=400682 RepID=A0AAN0JCR7_AMPQE|nr:PREDICTED: uncharacterized protein LOC109583778 [Amphimedon queenslandica]|eukprot:XP_019854800.1 PREDICTED: uncharacterized protein LOC109583778 [Amphimedon queenslandica]
MATTEWGKGSFGTVTVLLNRPICIGNPDSIFTGITQQHNGYFKDRSGTDVVAYYDSRMLPSPTVRHSSCQLFLDKLGRCSHCEKHRLTLSAMVGKQSQSDPTRANSHVNYKHLTSEQKDARMANLHQEKRFLKQKVVRLKVRLDKEIAKIGVVLDDDTSSDLHQIMVEHDDQVKSTHSPESFPALFWEQQKKAVAVHSSKGMRWHLLIIK